MIPPKELIMVSFDMDTDDVACRDSVSAKAKTRSVTFCFMVMFFRNLTRQN